jgi:copper transport protein
MPDLAEGAYIASWRVLSSDSHPVAGAVAFGVGVDAVSVPTSSGTGDTAPWPVVAARFLGYAGFAVFLGGFAFLLWCWPRDRAAPARLERLPMLGLVTGLVASVLGLALQGPYLSGLPMREVTDFSLLAHTGETTFGFWMQVRVFLYLTIVGVLWGDRGLRASSSRWVGGVAAVAVAVSFSGTGHAAASGALWDRAVDSVHVLAAGTWVGGLVLLVVLLRGRADDEAGPAVARFSRLAMGSVAVLVLTGTLSAVIQLSEPADLWQTRYGKTLLIKLGVVVVALAAAGVSRRFVQGDRSPWRSVRVEAAATSVVLVVTALLTVTAPPSRLGPTDGTRAASPTQQRVSRTTVMDLGEGRTAELRVNGLRRGSSDLRLTVLDADGTPLPVNRIELKLALPEEDLGPFDVPLREAPGGWSAGFAFALAGTWIATLTVEDQDLAGTVTTGEVRIAG